MVKPFPAACLRDTATSLAAQLEAAAAAVYEAPGQEQAVLAQMLPQSVMKSLPSESLEAQLKHLQRLAGQLLNRPVLGLTVAREPSAAGMRRLLAWLVKHGPGECVVELVVDASVVGGAIVEWQGRRGEYAVAQVLKQVASL